MKINLQKIIDMGFHVIVDERENIIEITPLTGELELSGLYKDLKHLDLGEAAKDAIMGAAFDAYHKQLVLTAIS